MNGGGVLNSVDQSDDSIAAASAEFVSKLPDLSFMKSKNIVLPLKQSTNTSENVHGAAT